MKLPMLKPGDEVNRFLGAERIGPMPLTVTAVVGNVVHCGPWTFDATTGGEIDEDCGWDGVTSTGSVIEVK